jgi:hypothetical protein
MNIEEQILINKFGQDLITFQSVINYFSSLDRDKQKKFLTGLGHILIQAKSQDSDIDNAITLGQLKSTDTPCVKIRKGVKGNVLQELIDLPDDETNKVLMLFLALYKVAYKRLLVAEEEFVDRIKSLSNLRLIVRKIFNQSGAETGVVITAFLPFIPTLYEKNIVERHLELYAFNNIYPQTGLNIYKEINDDTASLTIIKDINNLPYDEHRISLY